MTNLLTKTIISAFPAWMIVLFLSGCTDAPPHTEPVSSGESQTTTSVPVIDETDPTTPVISIRLSADSSNQMDQDCLVLGIRTPDSDELSLIHGTYERVAGNLTFTPTFPLLPNQEYEAVNLQTGESNAYQWSVSAGPPPTVTITPSLGTLPANHLKFYLAFSEPMQQDNPWEHCRLRDITIGEFVPRPFRHTELWNRSSDRLTLWFHPGRQKTGVNLNVEIGPILEPGHQYELTLDGDWKSLAGTPIGEDVSIRFSAGPPDHDQPDPESWAFVEPSAGTVSPLAIDFGESLDHALLMNHALEVIDNGKPVESRQEVSTDGKSINIIPTKAWDAKTYTIKINPRLEDLAGNSVERPFEVDLRNSDADQSQATSISFTIKP